MNTKTKLSLVAILASCLVASVAIGSAQAGMRHHQAARLVPLSQALCGPCCVRHL
jgi:hypothetical protein